jgi:hypothetical protein
MKKFGKIPEVTYLALLNQIQDFHRKGLGGYGYSSLLDFSIGHFT